MCECVLSTQGWTDIQSCRERVREREREVKEEKVEWEQGEEDGERGGARDWKFHESSFIFVFIPSLKPLQGQINQKFTFLYKIWRPLWWSAAAALNVQLEIVKNANPLINQKII